MSLSSPVSLDSDPPPPPPTLDSVLAKLGNPGKYQVSNISNIYSSSLVIVVSVILRNVHTIVRLSSTISTFQIVLMLLLATNYIPVVVNHLLMAFYSAKVPFHCKVAIIYIRSDCLSLLNFLSSYTVIDKVIIHST